MSNIDLIFLDDLQMGCMMNAIVLIFFFSLLSNPEPIYAMERKGSKPKSSKSIPVPVSTGRGRRLRSDSEAETELGDLTVLMQAIKAGDIITFDATLKKKIDINGCDQESNTPLSTAIFMGNYTMAQRLLAEGASLQAVHCDPMWIALLMGNRNIIKLLNIYAVKAGIGVNTRSECQVERRTYRECSCKACTLRLQFECKRDSAVRTEKDLLQLNRIDALTPEQVAKIDALRAQRIHDLMQLSATRSRMRSFLNLDEGAITTDSAKFDAAALFDDLMKPQVKASKQQSAPQTPAQHEARPQ